MSMFPPESSSFTQAAQRLVASHKNIDDFWHSKAEGTLQTFDKKSLYWCKFTHPTPNKAILLINGRVESCYKYQEVFFDLYSQGFDVYSFDHRGQGLSERLAANRQIGHVAFFEDYVQDLDAVIQHFRLTDYANAYLLSHSMGGAIAIRYIETHPKHSFKALALTSPMLGFNLPWYIKFIAIPATQLLAAMAQLPPNYAPGQGPYTSDPFSLNPLTHSQSRYDWFRELYEKVPELKIGGPSIQWVWQSLLAMKQCYQLTRQVTLPTLLLQAGKDEIVNNFCQDRFIKKLKKTNTCTEKCTIEHAKHELLFEQDGYRNDVLTRIVSFFSRYDEPC